MNITKQPLPLAFTTLIAVVLLALWRSEAFAFGGPVEVVSSTFLAQWIGEWQRAHSLMADLFSAVIVVMGALMITRIGTRHGLYQGGGLIAMPLFALLAMGLFLAQDCLVGFVAALLLIRSLRNLCSSARNGYTFTPLFRGALYLGILPLLLPQTLLLLPILMVALVLFKRTLREGIVAFGGLLLPVATACYLSWAFAYPLEAPVVQLFTILSTAPRLHLFEGASPLLAVQLTLLLAATLCALFYFLSDRYSSTYKTRAMLMLFSWSFLLMLASLFLGGATVNLFIPLAVPCALLLPYLFVRLAPLYANLLYALLLLSFVVRLFL